MNEKIKILYFHNKSEISGGEQSLINLWENIDRSRFDLIAILPCEGPFSKEAEKLNIKLHYLSLPSLTIANVFKLFDSFLKIKTIIKQDKVDVIHSYSPRNNIISSIIGKILKKVVIWHERNLIFGNEKDLTKKYISYPDAIICNSKAVAERFRIKGSIPKKVKVILNGVNLLKFNKDVDGSNAKKEFNCETQKIVGIVSNFSKRKRIGFFLTIASIIKSRFHDVKFLIVGGEFSSGNTLLFDDLKSKVKKLNIEDSVVFTGFKGNMPEIISSFDVSVLTAVKEACSRAILESMAAAKPVVAVNDGGNPELIVNNETGFLIEQDEGSLVNFTDKILQLLNDEQLRIKMGNNARDRAEEYFDVKKNAIVTENLYIELLNNNAKRS